MNNPIPEAIVCDPPAKWHSRDVFWFCLLSLVLGAGFGACGMMFGVMTAQAHRTHTADDISRLPVPPSAGPNTSRLSEKSPGSPIPGSPAAPPP